jgi:reductive dehalogenase
MSDGNPEGSGGEKLTGQELNRRDFFKAAGLISAAAGGAGLGAFGYAAGKDPDTYLGWQNEEGASLIFNRTRYEVDEPTYQKVGPGLRPDSRVEQIFERRGRFMREYRRIAGGQGGMRPPAGGQAATGSVGAGPAAGSAAGAQEEPGQGPVTPEDFSEPLGSYYRERPQDLELDILNMTELGPLQRADSQEYGEQFLLAEAWSAAMGAVGPGPITGPPEENDFPRARFGPAPEPAQLKDPEKTAELIKAVSLQLGSTLVGITELNPDWVYGYPIRGRGFEDLDEPLEVRDWWTYAIVVGTPMSWDPMYANPNYGTSNDAYSRSRIIAARLEAFIKALGYPARSHIPGTSYDLMVPPVAIDAGLGEQGRNGIVITPEVGCNLRPAVVTTNIPVTTDKPIDIGVDDFCLHCKVCAEACPSGAIPMGDKVEVRGYRRWKIDTAKCQNFWTSNLGNMGCRICVSVCPYTRKANWLHSTAMKVSANDPTGVSEKVLTSMQKSFYPGPDPEDYFMPSLGGTNASYREPPPWLRTEDYIDLE